MKRLLTAALLLTSSYVTMLAANTKQSVEQVTTDVELIDDVDYHITSTEPFTTTGSINIVNTDHAVVILDNLKPSLAKSFLGFIKINGEAAKDGSNCQLKLYDRGAILLPYGGTAFRPLTVFDGEDFSGESFNTFTEGHNGSGFMKDIPSAWNNRIKSFKLKRGYMVTFALKKGGYGYSRCFIAAYEDLEMTLPSEIAGRISSYRLFKWYDTSKVGVSDMGASDLAKLNAQTTFTWGPGSNMLPDIEVVPHHIHETWPSPGECGSVSFSPNMKTNNEPRNPSEKDGTWTMEQILANWEALMATGMRLCTPSSWDGSDYWNATGFLADFLNEIDKRGWRCDIIDLHGYWNEGSFTTNVNNWASTFKRPVWITEWLWGASWSGGSGIFKEASSLDNPTAADLQKNKDVVSRILNNLNGNDACERYFYWNGERNCSKILRDGNLTPAGEYFATMKTNGPGYTGYGKYIPKMPTPTAVTDLNGTFTPSTKTFTIKWTNHNGDLSLGVGLQRRVQGGKWETIYSFKGADNEDLKSVTFKDVLTAGDNYEYRVVDTVYTKRALNSNTISLNIPATKGTNDVQYGSVSTTAGEKTYCFFGTPFDEQPAVVAGSTTYKNSAGVINNLLTISKSSGQYSYFSCQNNIWTGTTATRAETTNYIAATPGNGKIGQLNYEAGYVAKDATSISYSNALSVKGEVVEVKFLQPFADVPVVMVTPIYNSESLPTIMWRVFDVTPEGFKLLLQYESTETKTISRKVSYFAIDKGVGFDGNDKLYTVGDAELTFKTAQINLPYGTTLTDPIMLAQLQSYNHQAGAILRIPSVGEESAYLRMQVDATNSEMQLSTSKSATERVGYILISDGSGYDAIDDIKQNSRESADATTYDLGGRAVNPKSLRKGVYIINGQKVMIK